MTALLFVRGSDRDINLRGAFLHMAADAGVSLAVVLGGVAIALTASIWVDPALSLVVVVVVLASTWSLARESWNLAVDAVPRSIDPGNVRTFLLSRPGVAGVHDLHIWGLSTTQCALTAHLVVPEGTPATTSCTGSLAISNAASVSVTPPSRSSAATPSIRAARWRTVDDASKCHEIAGAPRYPFASRGTPFQVARTEGCYLITPDGRRVLDAAGGAIVVNIGHGRREVAEVYAQAAQEVTYVVPPFVTGSRARLTERLVDRWLPTGLTRVAFTCGGSESVDAAVRLARSHHLAAGRPAATR